MSKIHRFYDFIGRHKYIVTILVIVLVVGFIDDNSWWNRRERKAHIQYLSDQIKFFNNQYNNDTRELKRLENRTYLERYAREKYHMKRANEDVFIIEE